MENLCIEFVHDLSWQALPDSTQTMARRCLLDLLGVAASGIDTDLSKIIRQHAFEHFGGSSLKARMLFDGRYCSPMGAALAMGMTIDAVDAHDGHKPTKGHAGCGVLPAVLAFIDADEGGAIAESELLTAMVIGYEIACRAGISLHESVPDYHTSGAWVAIAAAAVGARMLKLDGNQTREAMGIAEYHGPRSQMMRCIDYPTMLKDGSGWGSMAGVSAAYLAKSGFTGAPAISVEAPEQNYLFRDLGSHWLIEDQYFKPYPVCRWAQPAIVAVENLQSLHAFSFADIRSVSIGTFHEACRLATARPSTTEQAQYSLPFPVASMLVNQRLSVAEISGDALKQLEVLSLSEGIQMHEISAYNDAFPLKRICEVTIELHDGRTLESGPTEANGDPEIPLSTQEIEQKFDRFAGPVLGENRSVELRSFIKGMGSGLDLSTFNRLVYSAIN